MEETDRECVIHGDSWDTFHGGYFSDPAVAGPLVQRILSAAATSKPRVIVDLGGGTGYVLSQLRAAGLGAGISLVNLESSEAQIATACKAGLVCTRGSVDAFGREGIGPESGNFLFIMRSVLHYFGQEGLRRVLRHVRAQARSGEFFVHQTASFQDQRDADALNLLYRMMGTQKWYPTVGTLGRCLAEEGWHVIEVTSCRPLVLTCGDLALRYSLDAADMLRIGHLLARDFPNRPAAFRHEADGFTAFLHYSIYVCSAIDSTSEGSTE
jgi:hypothetical protein